MSLHNLDKSELEYYEMLDSIKNNSPCTKRKVGAILFKNSTYITGYNYPSVRTDNITVDDTGEALVDIVHAEMDIITKLANIDTMTAKNSTLFTTLSPCFQCAKNLARIGIKKIYFKELHQVAPLVLLMDAGIEVYKEISFVKPILHDVTFSVSSLPENTHEFTPLAIFERLNDTKEYIELLKLSKQVPKIFYYKPY